ncbi:MAG TPA: histidine phosphatase family protein [Acidimicrobiales bacterium]|nr:histidine phosphatase family protein [Acidimicrobiales bacterium]
MSNLLIVRHGQSEWNAVNRWQGQEDSPLSEHGRQQAFAASVHVGVVDLIVASDLERARVTAEIIAESIGVGPVQVDPDLRERHAGEWQGLTRSEIHERFPGWLDDGRRPEGWEPDEAVVERASASLRRWAPVGATILVVSHGGVIRTLETSLGEPGRRVPNLGGRTFVGEDTFHLGEAIELIDEDLATTPQGI